MHGPATTDDECEFSTGTPEPPRPSPRGENGSDPDVLLPEGLRPVTGAHGRLVGDRAAARGDEPRRAVPVLPEGARPVVYGLGRFDDAPRRLLPVGYSMIVPWRWCAAVNGVLRL
ncbi:hypothetical protein [Streptomyces sp. H27-S2]|uniref:hypothetical protein n=1 Tax=Streptomyces antarcticus TaxID=2996458 RepID=UPI00226ED321|nr:hypothetical protein [Streptomyces sp. H27-S2]MCY0953623.1 hypothetical protein [Streptomyces sp. H27-S2]